MEIRDFLNNANIKLIEKDYKTVVYNLLKIVELQQETIKLHEELIKQQADDIYSLKIKMQNNSYIEEE